MNHFYRRLALTNMKKNRQFYYPYLLTSVISVMLFYCMSALSLNEGFKHTRGAESIIMVMRFGTVIIGIFVTILLFYTNSYIMKRRKKELGVYNILGMEKKHLAAVLTWEIITSYCIAVVSGLVLGIAFHKYFSMILYRITGLQEVIRFYICKDSCIRVFAFFACIYALNLCNNIMQIKLAKPIELLHSVNTGEREPKAKILMTILGILFLAAGYVMALSIKNPVTAISMFFIAVIFVIIATYALFTSGSIALLKLLRKNKNFYYQTRHFTAVSGMLYRMKQNAVGLSNICILSTMVLVVLTSTISIYVGLDDFVDSKLEADINVKINFQGIPSEEVLEQMKHSVGDTLTSQGRKLLQDKSYTDFSFVGVMKDNEVVHGSIVGESVSYSDTVFVELLTQQEYEDIYQKSIKTLGEQEVIICAEKEYRQDSLVIQGLTFEVVQSELREEQSLFSGIIENSLIVVVKDVEELKRIFAQLCTGYQEGSTIPSPFVIYQINYDIDGIKEERLQAAQAVRESLNQWNYESEVSWELVGVNSKVETFQEYLIANGGIFFLGVFLGCMFLMITVLIIYYKQIAEGYEDRERFLIMQKVGMSKQEVKDTIRSQVRIVFFLPLITANLHLLIAFPMIKKIMGVIFLANPKILFACMVGTVIAFAVIYDLVYRITSKSYYKIVG